MSVKQALIIASKGMTFDIVRESRLFPPIGVLNSFFKDGVDDVEPEGSFQWEPFMLTQAEFDEFFASCKMLYGELQMDGLGHAHYADWFSSVAIRNSCGE